MPRTFPSTLWILTYLTLVTTLLGRYFSDLLHSVVWELNEVMHKTELQNICCPNEASGAEVLRNDKTEQGIWNLTNECPCSSVKKTRAQREKTCSEPCKNPVTGLRIKSGINSRPVSHSWHQEIKPTRCRVQLYRKHSEYLNILQDRGTDSIFWANCPYDTERRMTIGQEPEWDYEVPTHEVTRLREGPFLWPISSSEGNLLKAQHRNRTGHLVCMFVLHPAPPHLHPHSWIES